MKRSIVLIVGAGLLFVIVWYAMTYSEGIRSAATSNTGPAHDVGTGSHDLSAKSSSIGPHSGALSPEGSPRSPHFTAPARLPEGAVRNYLPELLRQSSGPHPSADAAFLAFSALNACKALAGFAAGSGNATNSVKQPDCQGITDKDWTQANRLLKLAADLGDERAQIQYAQKIPIVDKTTQDFIQRPEDLVEFKVNANRYLTAASENGNIEAMLILSNSLANGDLMEKNVEAAYQYRYAISRIASDIPSIPSSLTQLESQLTPMEVQRARESADKFLVRCCHVASSASPP